MEVFIKQAIQCKTCKEILYSRCNHDFKYCDCGKIFVDGGGRHIENNVLVGYTRLGFGTYDDIKTIENLIVNVQDAENIKDVQRILYDDWNEYKSKDIYGRIKGE